MKYIGKKKKILILVLMLAFVITVTPILGTQIHRIVKRNSLRLGYYTIESVECIDRFGYPITLMVKSTLNINYQIFPETIIPFEYNTYFDNEANYICYGIGNYDDSIFTFSFDLEIKVKQDLKSQKIRYTAIAIEGFM